MDLLKLPRAVCRLESWLLRFPGLFLKPSRGSEPGVSIRLITTQLDERMEHQLTYDPIGKGGGGMMGLTEQCAGGVSLVLG